MRGTSGSSSNSAVDLCVGPSFEAIVSSWASTLMSAWSKPAASGLSMAASKDSTSWKTTTASVMIEYRVWHGRPPISAVAD